MLTPEQEQAIAFGDGNLHLVACAGSGKTETITRRIARLVADGVPPGSIVAFTFTDKAAREMAARVRRHLEAQVPGQADLAGMYVGTIHGYCHQRLKEAVPKFRTYDLLDEDLRPLFCYRHYTELGLDRLLDYYEGQRFFPSAYDLIHDFCRNADLVRDEMIVPTELFSPFRDCYLAYLERLHDLHYLDFGGMIAHYVEALLGDPALLARERERVRHLVVDEYQDVNTLQEALIRLMVGENGNLCVVGDDDQCIYQWRGSNYENIITFGERYPAVTTIRVQQNFRSTPALVTAAATVIARNQGRLPKEMLPWRDGQCTSERGDIVTCFFRHEADEVAAVVEQVRRLHGRPFRDNRGTTRPLEFRDMAILMRSVRSRARALLDALSGAGIPFIVKGGRLFERPEVDVVLHALAYLGGHPYPLHDAAPPVGIDHLREGHERLAGSRVDSGSFVAAVAAARDEALRAEALSLQALFHQVLRAMGGDRAAFPETWYYNLGHLSQLVSAFEHLYPRIGPQEIRLFLEYVRDDAWSRTEEGNPGELERPDAVTVSTLHKAKGLQFPVVFMPRLNMGEFPSDMPDTTTWFVPATLFDRERYRTGIEDERRLFYVGITRSEKYLFLSGHHYPLLEGYPSNPSIFLNEYPREDAVDAFPFRPSVVEPRSAEVPIPSHEPPVIETNWSALRYYARCPRDYQIRYIYGFDPMPKEEIGLGEAVHSVLAEVHQRATSGPFDVAEIPGIVDEHLILRFAAPETVGRIREIVKHQATRYVQRNTHDFVRVSGVEVPFTIPVGNGLVSGAIDLMLRDGEGIELRDFKLTESGESGFRLDTERQLQLYAIAVRALGQEVRRAGIYHFDTGTVAEVDVNPEALEEAGSAIVGMIEGIRRCEFSPTPEERRCASCDWRCICSETP